MSEINKKPISEDERQFKKTVWFFAKLAIIVLFLCIFGSCMVTTEPNEYNVILQFGKIVRVETEPGLSFRAPLIQKTVSVNKEIMFYDIASSDVITSDKKTMIVDAFVLWRITDPEKFMTMLSGSVSNAEGRLNTVVYNAMKNTISSMSQNEVILSRDGKVDVSIVDSELITNDLVVSEDEDSTVIEIKSLTELIMENLSDTDDLGIEIVVTEVKMLDLPDANKSAVYQRMISERQNVAASYEAQGRSDAQLIRNTTDKEIAIMTAEANAEAEKIIAEGESEYMKILSNAYNDLDKKEFYSFVRALDAAKESLKGGSKTLILDSDSPLAQIFYVK